MKTYRELLQTDTYWITKIQNDLFNAVEDYLRENKMTRAQFAAQLGVSKGYVSQILGGEFNHRLSKLVELSLAIGKAPVLEFKDLDEVDKKEAAAIGRRKATRNSGSLSSPHISRAHPVNTPEIVPDAT